MAQLHLRSRFLISLLNYECSRTHGFVSDAQTFSRIYSLGCIIKNNNPKNDIQNKDKVIFGLLFWIIAAIDCVGVYEW